jgi:hypothetical protein
MNFLIRSGAMNKTTSLGNQFENILYNKSDYSYLTAFMQMNIASLAFLRTGHPDA